MKALFFKLNNSIGGGAMIIAFFSLLSKLLGLLRDRLLASHFGAGADLDVYFAAFKIPDFIFSILVLGALSMAFIPIFQRVYRRQESAGLELANSALNILLLVIGGLTLLAIIFVRPLTSILVPGFTGGQYEQTVMLTRIMLLSIILFTASNVMSGMLNAWKKFLTFSLSSVLYNLGIIIGIIFFLPRWGLVGLAWGVDLGAFLHFFIQYLEVRQSGWHYRFVINFTDDLRRLFKLMIPRTIGSAATQINAVAITIIASMLPFGALSIFNLANNLQGFPASLFGLSLAVSSFPHFTKLAHEKNFEAFQKVFFLQFRRILYLAVPTSVILVVERAHIVRVVLGSGNFNWTDTILTANTLGIFAISIFAQCLIPLVSLGFYSHEDTKTPVIISLITTIINIVLALVLAKPLGVLGLTLAFTIATIINLLMLMILFKIKIGYIDQRELLQSTGRIAVAAVLAGLACYSSLRLFVPLIDQRTFIGIFLQGALAGLAGMAVYLAISTLFNYPEIRVLRAYWQKLWRKSTIT